MEKMMVSLAVVMALVAGTAGTCLAARYSKCEVKEIKGETVVLECDKTGGLEPGSKVRVRRVKVEEAFEGC